MIKNKCSNRRGNVLCTNGEDTYHEWNTSHGGSCNFCGQKDPNGIEEEGDICKCKRCKNCGKLLTKV